MKKVISIFFLFISFTAFGQDTPYVKPVTPTPMSSNYWFKQQVKIDSVLQARKAIFRDTTAFQGRTFVPNALDNDSNKIAVNTEYMKKWIADNVSPGIPGEPVSSWATAGNYAPSDPNPYRLGMKDSMPIYLMTNSQIRLTIPDNGIKRNSGAASKVLTMDTVTKALYYTDMAGGGGVTSDQTIVSTAGQEDFTFTDVPSSFDDFLIFRNGMEVEHTTYFTKSGNTISFIIPLDADDRIRMKRIK